jgi:hypothetical protein
VENHHFLSPEDAENALYKALSTGSRVLLTKVWGDTTHPILVKANGEIVAGSDAIIADVSATFEGRATLIYRIGSTKKSHDQTTAIHCVEESIYIEGDRRRQSYAISTNVFVQTMNGWKLTMRQITNGVPGNRPRIERRELPNSLVRNLGVLDLLR